MHEVVGEDFACLVACPHPQKKELSKLNSKKKESNKKFRKWVKDINSHLAEENIHVVLTVSALGVGGQSSSHA